MCPVQWVRSSSRSRILPFVEVKEPVRIYMLTSPDEHAILMLHRIDSYGRSFPCLGENQCRHHDKEPFPYAYAGVVWFDRSLERWRHGILGMGDPSHDLVTTDYRGGELLIERKDRKNKRSALVVMLQGLPLKNRPPLTMMDGFDPRPYILRRWGLFADAELIGCELHLPDPNYQAPDPDVEGL